MLVLAGRPSSAPRCARAPRRMTSPISSSASTKKRRPDLGRQAAGAGVRRVDQARSLEVRHDVADRGRRQRHRQDAREVARADRLAGRQIALDDPPEDLARALVRAPRAAPARRMAEACPLCMRSWLVQPLSGRIRLLSVGMAPGRDQDASFAALLAACRARALEPAPLITIPGATGVPCGPRNARPTNCAPSRLERGVARYAEGSCLVKLRRHACAVHGLLEEHGPPWLRGTGKGWVTAEYAMLPRATARAHAPRGDRRQAVRPHAGDPAADRPLAARRRRPAGARRAADHHRLRRDPGRRRHAHRRRSPARWVALHDCLQWMQGRSMICDQPAARPRRGDLLRHLSRARRCSTSTTPRIRAPRPTPISS